MAQPRARGAAAAPPQDPLDRLVEELTDPELELDGDEAAARRGALKAALRDGGAARAADAHRALMARLGAGSAQVRGRAGLFGS
jgi:hypothetical protein